MEFISTKRNGRALVYQGYKYALIVSSIGEDKMGEYFGCTCTTFPLLDLENKWRCKFT